MHKIDTAGAAAGNQFTVGNPVTGVPATTLGSDWPNAVQGELVSVIEGAGIALVKGTNNQLLSAIQAWIISNTVGGSRVLGADCKNNAGTPNTQFDLDADAVVLRNASNQIVVRHDPGAALTNNVSTAGPAANGRDQAGAFGASSWVHFYWIWNGATLATLSSAVAPPTGPTLPGGYTHWAYAGAVRFNGSSQLVKTRIKGDTARYEAAQSALAGGAATVETSIDLSALVPPNALRAAVKARMANSNTGGANALSLRLVAGTEHTNITAAQAAAGPVVTYDDGFLEIPNIGQALLYLNSLATGASSVDVLGYVLPNGGE